MPFTDQQLTAAIAEESPRWKFVPGTRYREMPRTFALQLLALAAYGEPDREVGGQTLASALIEKLHPLLGGLPADDAEGNTREPEAQGGISGWTHAAPAFVLLIAKRLPTVWSQLSDDERHRADLIMQALAVAGHFTMSDANSYHVLMDGISNHDKSWNINITEGYVDVLIAAGLYFGAAELNAWFKQFDFDAFVAEADRMRLRNIVRCWKHRPFIRDLVMDGGVYSREGSGPTFERKISSHGQGVRCDCYFQGFGLDETWSIFRTQATRQFSKACRTEVAALAGESTRLLQRETEATVSPWEGQLGMCVEFETNDWYGIRSCLTYVFEGVMIQLGTAASLRVLGLWPDNAERRYLEQCMAVGVSDLMFKGREGYRGWAHGKETIEGFEQMTERGADYIFPMWSELFPGVDKPL